MQSQPLVSCLCVTEDRAAFMPWLLWGFARQTWTNKELIIVDSSREACSLELPEGARLVRAAPGARVAEKRNLALEHARGEALAWFDDDDWQHAQRLELLARELVKGAGVVGTGRAWFLDLWNEKCRPYSGRTVLFNGALFRRSIACSERFDAGRVRGSDTVWMRALAARYQNEFRLIDAPLFVWLVHDANLSNPRRRRPCALPTSRLRSDVAREAWGDTDTQLRRLRERLGSNRRPLPAPAAPARGAARARPGPAIIASWDRRGGFEPLPKRLPAQVAAIEQAAPAADQSVDSSSPPSVGAFVKATVLDAPYIETIARHMLEQAKFDFAERMLVIDPRLEFTGKYRNRARFERAALDRAVSHLVAGGIVDRVLEVPQRAAEVELVLDRYFVPNGRRVPTHAVTGGPVYPTLYALEAMASDLVVQFDGDMFFHAADDSWVREGLRVLGRHSDVWFVMMHGGPPAGPADSRSSLGPLNARRCEWDPTLQTWRFRTVSTRYFLTDRRRLRHRVPILRRGSGILPLEQCLSAALVRGRAVRVGMPSTFGWDLHAHSHAAPFAAWAPAIAELIKRGVVPGAQRGSYDLRLDKPAMREAWRETLERHGTRASNQRELAEVVSACATLGG